MSDKTLESIAKDILEYAKTHRPSIDEVLREVTDLVHHNNLFDLAVSSSMGKNQIIIMSTPMGACPSLFQQMYYDQNDLVIGEFPLALNEASKQTKEFERTMKEYKLADEKVPAGMSPSYHHLLNKPRNKKGKS